MASSFLQPSVIVAGLVVGFLVGLTGVGGGSLLTPILVLLGVPPATAVGTDLLYGSVTKMAGTWQHYKQGSVDWRWVRMMAMGSVPAAIVAVVATHLIGERYGATNAIVKTSLGFVLVIAAVAIALHDVFRGRQSVVASTAPSIDPATMGPKIIAFSAVIGFLVGMTSIGSGSLIAIMLLFVSRLKPLAIIGTDIAHALLLVSAAALAHWKLGTVDVSLAFHLLIGSLPGVLIGSRLAHRTPSRLLRWIVAILILAGGIKMLVKS